MKFYIIRINLNPKEIFGFVRFCEKNKINIYMNWQEEDMFNDLMFILIGTDNKEAQHSIENIFSKQIKQMEVL